MNHNCDTNTFNLVYHKFFSHSNVFVIIKNRVGKNMLPFMVDFPQALSQTQAFADYQL